MITSINDSWNKFFKSEAYEEDIVEIIKLVMSSFLEFLVKEDLLERIPEFESRYQAFIYARDITAVKNILFLELDLLQQIGNCEVRNIVSTYKNKLGYQVYQTEISKQNELILKLEKYKEFMDAIYTIMNARNDSKHNILRNDSGYALMIASAIFNLIDLSPVKIEEDRRLRLRELNMKLIETVYEIEVYDEEAEEEMEEDASLEVENILGDQLIEEMQSKLDEFSAGLTSQISIIENQVISIHESLEKKEAPPGSYESLRERDEADRKEFFEKMASELTQEEWDKEFNSLSEIVHEEEEKIVNDLSQEEFDEKYNERQSLLTGQQAMRELLMLQKEIKRTFKCRNWENIAQGPFRENILDGQIKNKEDWFDNEFISNRYHEHSYIMDQQLNSEIGDRYFSILKRITWNS